MNHSNCWQLWFVVHLLDMRVLKSEAALKEELGRCSMKRKSLSIQLDLKFSQRNEEASQVYFLRTVVVADWLVG